MKILLVDDHAILRKGLIEIIREEFPNCNFFEASNGIEGLSILRKETLSLALLDISMPELNGIEVLKQVKVLGIETPIIILSMQPEEQYALRVLKAGAYGYLNKDSAPNELINAVKKILEGKKYISSVITDLLADSIGQKNVTNLFELLSDRELQVLELIANGKSVSQIADEILLSVNTISTYRSRILQKLSLKNNAALVRYAIDHKII